MQKRKSFLTKLCAWMITVATLATSFMPTGLVFADETASEPKAKLQMETQDSETSIDKSDTGKIFFKLPSKGGELIVKTSEEDVQTIRVANDGKTYSTDKDGNSQEVTLTEDGYCLELTKDIGTVIDVDVKADNSFSIATYRLTKDSGEEVENVDVTTLSSEYKDEVTVEETTLVVEVDFNKEEVKETETIETKEPESKPADEAKETATVYFTAPNVEKTSAITIQSNEEDTKWLRRYGDEVLIIDKTGDYSKVDVKNEYVYSIEYPIGTEVTLGVDLGATDSISSLDILQGKNNNISSFTQKDKDTKYTQTFTVEEDTFVNINFSDNGSWKDFIATVEKEDTNWQKQKYLRTNGGDTVNVIVGDVIHYGSWTTNMFSVNGHVAYCSESNKGTPSGWYRCDEYTDDTVRSFEALDNQGIVSITNRNWVKTTLLCAPGGPLDGKVIGYPDGRLFWDNNPNVVNGNVHANAHATLSYIYCGDLTGLSDSYAQGIIGFSKLVYNVWSNGPHMYDLDDRGNPKWDFETGVTAFIARTENHLQDIMWYEMTPKGSLNIQKTSGNNGVTSGNSSYSFEGALYYVWDTPNVDTTAALANIKIGADGKGKTDIQLPAGHYYIREDKAPKGYTRDTTVYEADVVAGKEDTFVPMNNEGKHKETPVTLNIDLTKVSGNKECTDNNPAYSLQGAVYNVYRNEACTDLATTITTDANGKGSATGLALGTYWVRERTPSMGFNIDENKYKVEATTGGGGKVTNATITKTVTSTEIPKLDPVFILLRKVDSTTGKNVPQPSGTFEGAQYEVKFYKGIQSDTDPALTGNRVDKRWIFKTDKDGYMQYGKDWLVSGDSFYLDPQGTPSLPYGTITFKEIKSPNGYQLDPKTHVVPIIGQGSNTISYQEPTSSEVPLTLNVLKKQSGTNIVIQGVEFTHTYTNIAGKQVSDKLVTGKDGKISIKGLTHGNHTLVESKTVDGYALNTNKITFTVATDNKITITSKATVTDTNGNITVTKEKDGNLSAVVENKPAPFDLKVHKTNNHDFVLEGAEFTLYSDAACKNVVKVGKTKSDGNLVMEDLIPEKTYYLKETKAPKGYRIPVNKDGSDIVWKISVKSVPANNIFEFYVNDKAYTSGSGQFSINNDKANRVCSMTIINEVGMKLPETGSYMMIVILIAGVLLIGGGLLVSKKGKGREKESEENLYEK